MKIEELKQLLEQTRAASESAWTNYQVVLESIEPVKQEWISLYREVAKLETKVALLEEIERESAEIQKQEAA